MGCLLSVYPEVIRSVIGRSKGAIGKGLRIVIIRGKPNFPGLIGRWLAIQIFNVLGNRLALKRQRKSQSLFTQVLGNLWNEVRERLYLALLEGNAVCILISMI